MILRRTQEMVSGDLSAALARQPSTDNTVVSLHTQVADYTLDGERFALLAAWGGRQEVMMDSRRISVDDDTWLPVPAGPATVRACTSPAGTSSRHSGSRCAAGHHAGFMSTNRL